jgi:hypothetical protein
MYALPLQCRHTAAPQAAILPAPSACGVRSGVQAVPTGLLLIGIPTESDPGPGPGADVAVVSLLPVSIWFRLWLIGHSAGVSGD